MAIKNREKGQFRTGAEQVEIAKKGGIASGEARREKKLLRDCLEILLQEEVGTKDGVPITATEAMAATAVKAAIKGDWKAWELVRDSVGQKPVDKVAVSSVNEESLGRLQAAIKERQNAKADAGGN